MGWTPYLTHRQAKAFAEVLSDEWNQPSRTDHYLMQIAAEIRMVRSMFAKSAPGVRLDQFRIPFKAKGVEEKELTPEQERKRDEMLRQIAIARVGGKVRVMPPPEKKE